MSTAALTRLATTIATVWQDSPATRALKQNPVAAKCRAQTRGHANSRSEVSSANVRRVMVALTVNMAYTSAIRIRVQMAAHVSTVPVATHVNALSITRVTCVSKMSTNVQSTTTAKDTTASTKLARTAAIVLLDSLDQSATLTLTTVPITSTRATAEGVVSTSTDRATPATASTAMTRRRAVPLPSLRARPSQPWRRPQSSTAAHGRRQQTSPFWSSSLLSLC